MTRRGGKPDQNQAAIVDGLRAAGYSVAITTKVGFGFPDLVVGKWRNLYPDRCPDCGRLHWYNWLLEVKSPGGRLNDNETTFHENWRGQVAVVYSLDEALEVCGGR